MRVTGGQWRGRRLLAVPGRTVRPTTDRVRESIFAILGPAVRAAAVVDLCCGSGALGVEALSRGALNVEFVDIAQACLRVTRENLQRCGAEPARWRLHRAEAVRWLDRRLAAEGPPLLVLADPPYGGPVAASLAALLAGAMPARLAMAVLEHPAGLIWPIPEAAADLWRLETRSYGRTQLSLLRPRPAVAEEDGHG